MNKLVMMLRVKDGMLFIKQWLANVEKFADEIVAVDNGSTDGTYEVLNEHPKVVGLEKTFGFDEGRDRIMLLEMARERKPDWMITLDVDEIFEDCITRGVIESYMNQSFFGTIGFRLYPMKNDEQHYSASFQDILFISQPRRYLFRNSADLYVPNVKIHCGVHGLSKKMRFSTFRILHLCDLHVEYRSGVYDNYLQLDSGRSSMYLKHKNNLTTSGALLPFKRRETALVYVLSEFFLLNLVYLLHYPFKKIMKIVRKQRYSKGKLRGNSLNGTDADKTRPGSDRL